MQMRARAGCEGPGNEQKAVRNMATGQVIAAVAVSLDGFIAGPDDGPDQPLGLGGEQRLR
jgi:hypothetical protein